MPLHVRMNMWMQHDCVPPHYALCSRQVMNEIFNEKWIGWGGPEAWPPRSPVLTSPDYFLWGFVKERVMAVSPTTPDDMKEEYAEYVPKLHHKCWLKLDGLFISELTSAYKLRASGSFESDYSDMFRFFDYFHTLRD